MGKRFAIVVGAAAACVMALGAQTAASGVDRVPPDLRLSGDKTQNPQNDTYCDGTRCRVIVNVRCGHQKCTERSRGKLTNVKNDKLKPAGPFDAAPGDPVRGTGPQLTLSQRRQVRRALRKGEKVKAKVTVRARDAAGNVATAERTIRLVKRDRSD